MEASGAGIAAASGGDAGESQQQQGQPAEGQDGQQQGQPQGDAAIQQMMDMLGGLQESHEQMREQLQTAQQPEEQQQPEQPATPDLSFLEDADPEQAAQRLQQLMRSEAGDEVRRVLQEQLGPVRDAVNQMQMSRETDELAAEFPDLKDANTAEQVWTAAQRYAAMVGQPELAANVPFIRMVYLAGRATELAQRQGDSAQEAQTATLEGASGASPGGQQGDQQKQIADSIAKSWGQGSNVLRGL